MNNSVDTYIVRLFICRLSHLYIFCTDSLLHTLAVSYMKLPFVNAELNFYSGVDNKYGTNWGHIEFLAWSGKDESRLETILTTGFKSDHAVKALGTDDPTIFAVVDGVKVHRKILIIGGKPVGEIPLKTMVATYKREQQLKTLDSPTQFTVPATA